MRASPCLRRCLVRCNHCGIYFLTDPRNAKREDLCCPFGCREARRKRRSTERSEAYYRSEEGKIKKRQQNEKRRRVGGELEQKIGPREEGEALPAVRAEGSCFDAGMVTYLRIAISLIEGRRVRREEVLEMLSEVLRQPSMGCGRGREYGRWHQNRDPP